MRKIVIILAFASLVTQADAQTFTPAGSPLWGRGPNGEVGLKVAKDTFQPIGTLDPNTQAWRPLLQPPTASILGGVVAKAAVANQFITGLGTDGQFTTLQPGFSNLSGSAVAAQMPAFTGGDCTTTAGSVSISCGTVFGRLLSAQTWAQTQTFTAAPIFSALTGHLSANGAGVLTASATILATDLAGTIDCAREPVQTGDVTSPAGSCAFTLATVNSNVGSFGGASSVPTFTVNGKGLLTAAGSIAVVAPAGTLSGTTLNSSVVNSSLGTFAAGAAATNVGSLGGDLTGTLPNPTIAAGAVTSAKMASGAAYGNLAANSIDPPKMAQAATKTIRGNPTGATANVSDNSLSTYADAETANTAQGSVYFRSATGMKAFTCPTSGNFLKFNGSGNDISCAASTSAVPTFQSLTTVGSGTYTTPSNATWLKVICVGGGAGGGGAGSGGGAGANGGNTTFGTSLLSASGAPGTAGGTASVSSPASGIALTGSSGGASASVSTAGNIALLGGIGGSSPLQGAGSMSFGNGIAASASSGSGGSGSGVPAGSTGSSGAGGGSGGYVEAIIPSPAASYAYTIGVGGAGGAGGAAARPGGTGGSGACYVEEHYGS